MGDTATHLFAASIKFVDRFSLDLKFQSSFTAVCILDFCGSDFHGGVCVPMDSPLSPHTRPIVSTDQERRGSPRFRVATISASAMLSDPAEVSSPLASDGGLLVPYCKSHSATSPHTLQSGGFEISAPGHRAVAGDENFRAGGNCYLLTGNPPPRRNFKAAQTNAFGNAKKSSPAA